MSDRAARLVIGLGRWQTVGLALVAGGLAGLGHAPFDLWPLGLLGFAGLTHLLGPVTPRRAMLTGWAAGTGYFALTLHWIVEPFLVDAARHGWMAPFALVFMAGGLALFWAGGLWIAARISPPGVGRTLAVLGGLSLAEWARGTVLTGFPWALPGYIWAETPVAQSAGIVGPYGLTALTISLAALLALSARNLRLLALPVLSVAALWVAGSGRVPDQTALAAPVTQLRLVQPNAPQDQKWDPAYVPLFFQRQIALTEPGGASPVDLVLWPETAITEWLDRDIELQRAIIAALPDGAGVVLGARRFEGRRFYNSAAVLAADGLSEQVYDKRHLVPFGEYIPFGGLFARLGIHGLASEEGGGFSAGSTAHFLDFGVAGMALPLICYESIFPSMSASGAERPDWILLLTNDAWFGTFAGPQQHFAQARMRAIEQGLPLIRVANTGISAIIDPFGQVQDSLPLGEAGRIDGALPAALAGTLYGRTGDWPVILLMVLCMVAGARWRPGNNH